MSQLSDRFYSLFQKEHTAFERWRISCLSLIVFYFLVFHPYLTTLKNIDTLEARLTVQAESLEQDLDAINVTTAGINRAIKFIVDASAFQDVYSDVLKWTSNLETVDQRYDLQSRKVASLRSTLPADMQPMWNPSFQPDAIIRTLREQRPDMMQGHSDNACFFQVEAAWLRCLIAQQMQSVNDKLNDVLDDKTLSSKYISTLQQEIMDNRSRYEEEFASAIARGELADLVSTYVGEEINVITQWKVEMDDMETDLTNQSKGKQQMIEAIRLRQADLEARRQDISDYGNPETPFGRLPLSFNGIMVCFPLLLLLAGILAIRVQLKLAGLRQLYLSSSNEQDSPPAVLSLLMPLLPEPEFSLTSRLWSLFQLLLPALIGVIALIQLRSVAELYSYGNSLMLIGLIPLVSLVLLVYLMYVVRLVHSRFYYGVNNTVG